MKKLLKIYKSLTPLFLLRGVLCIVNAYLAGSAVTESLRMIVNAVFSADEHGLTRSISEFIVLSALVIVSRIILNITAYKCNKEGNKLLERSLLQNWSLVRYRSFYQRNDINAQIQKNTQVGSVDFLDFIFSVFYDIALLVSSIIYAMTIDQNVAIICIILMILILTLSMPLTKKLDVLSVEYYKRKNVVYARTVECIENVEVARFLGYSLAHKAYHNSTDSFLEIDRQANRIMALASSIRYGGKLITFFMAAFIGGILMLRGQMRMDQVVALILIMPIIAGAFLSFAFHNAKWKNLKAGVENLKSILEMDLYQDGKMFSERITKLKVKDVFFSYGTKRVLSNINFTLHSNMFVTIMGSSGSGKSTLAKLLLNLLPLEEGRIKWNDCNLEEIDRMDLWKHVGYMEQTPSVLSDSVRENILMSKDYDMDRFYTALCKADLLQWFQERAEDTIDETKISSGELQKICFARLFYQDYDCVILDEATSALDTQSEKKIIQSLMEYAHEGHIVIAITHSEQMKAASDLSLRICNGRMLFC